MTKSLLIAILLISVIAPMSISADDPSQAGIDQRLAILEVDCGITPAFPGEWIAQTPAEVILLYEYLGTVHRACLMVAQQLWFLDGAPDDMTPLEHFRFHFNRAALQLDRSTHLGQFWGNTAPRFENGAVVGYMIQLAHEGFADESTFAHEMGHVVDGLLGDVPQRQHLREVGGVASTVGWLPGDGYWGYELLFPRSAAGPNEDFAETFGQMMMGHLSPYNGTAPRWWFMVRHTSTWLHVIRELEGES